MYSIGGMTLNGGSQNTGQRTCLTAAWFNADVSLHVLTMDSRVLGEWSATDHQAE